MTGASPGKEPHDEPHDEHTGKKSNMKALVMKLVPAGGIVFALFYVYVVALQALLAKDLLLLTTTIMFVGFSSMGMHACSPSYVNSPACRHAGGQAGPRGARRQPDTHRACTCACMHERAHARAGART